MPPGCFMVCGFLYVAALPLYSNTCSSRVEAMQLGDCGQEMALISRLTEGSKVFLTREESQYFIKE